MEVEIMSKANELLDGLTNEEISAYTASQATEEHIIIDQNRFITVPESLKRIAVQFDHDVETVTFDCPRYWDDIDMSTMHVYINYMLKDGTLGSYLADNVRVDSSDSSMMHFDWTISRNITYLKGEISFLICIKKSDTNGVEQNHWNSELNRDMYVSEGLECDEAIPSEHIDLIEQLLVRFENASTDILNSSKAYADKKVADKVPFYKIEPNPYETEGFTTSGSVYYKEASTSFIKEYSYSFDSRTLPVGQYCIYANQNNLDPEIVKLGLASECSTALILAYVDINEDGLFDNFHVVGDKYIDHKFVGVDERFNNVSIQTQNYILEHNRASDAHRDIRDKIDTKVNAHNTSDDAHGALFGSINASLQGIAGGLEAAVKKGDATADTVALLQKYPWYEYETSGGAVQRFDDVSVMPHTIDVTVHGATDGTILSKNPNSGTIGNFWIENNAIIASGQEPKALVRLNFKLSDNLVKGKKYKFNLGVYTADGTGWPDGSQIRLFYAPSALTYPEACQFNTDWTDKIPDGAELLCKLSYDRNIPTETGNVIEMSFTAEKDYSDGYLVVWFNGSNGKYHCFAFNSASLDEISINDEIPIKVWDFSVLKSYDANENGENVKIITNGNIVTNPTVSVYGKNMHVFNYKNIRGYTFSGSNCKIVNPTQFYENPNNPSLLLPTGTYTFSCRVTGSREYANKPNFSVFFYIGETKLDINMNNFVSGTATFKKTFTVTEPTAFKFINVWFAEIPTSADLSLDFQLEVGDTATEYEPYIEPRTVNPSITIGEGEVFKIETFNAVSPTMTVIATDENNLVSLVDITYNRDINDKIEADILEHNTSSDAHSAKFTEINNQLSQKAPIASVNSAINTHNNNATAHGINKIKTDITFIKNYYATKSYVSDSYLSNNYYPVIRTTKASDVDTYEIIMDDIAPVNQNLVLSGAPSTLFFVSGKNLFYNPDNFAIGSSISPGETLTSEPIFSCLPGGSYKFVVNENPDTLIPGLQVILTFYDSSMSEIGTTTITDVYDFYTYDYGTQFNSDGFLSGQGLNYIKIQLYNSNSDTSINIESLMIVPSSISSNEYSEYQSYDCTVFDENGEFSEESRYKIARFPVTYIRGMFSSVTATYNRDVGKVISELQTTIANLT